MLPTTSSAAAGFQEGFLEGREVVLDGLASRPELSGSFAKVLHFEESRDRVTVELVDTGQKLLVRRECAYSLEAWLAKEELVERTRRAPAA